MFWLIWLVLMLMIAAAPAVHLLLEQHTATPAHASPGHPPTDTPVEPSR